MIEKSILCGFMQYRIRMVVAYDGFDFLGWQVQPRGKTVAGELEETFFAVFKKKISLLGASRTDSGVHALGQVVLGRTELGIEPEKMRVAWNNSLPLSIVIRSLEVAPEDFHPFHGVDFKTYYYHFFLKPPLPHVARYGWQFPYVRDVRFDVFERCLKLYEGTHDFTSFCTLETGVPDEAVRTVHSVSLTRLPRFNAGRITVVGKSFVRFQIRRMIGAAFDVARRPGWTEKTIAEMLANPDPQQELIRAEAHGLCLRKIVYGGHD